MGFDVTWHPISQEEMFLWYFDRLEEARRGDYATAMALAAQHRMGQEAGYQDFCQKGYRAMLEQAAQLTDKDPFDKTHSYILAMIQGLFRTYYYTRGGIFSGLAEMEPRMAGYTLPFQAIIGDEPQWGTIRNRIYENYCGGVYIPETAVPRLLADYEKGSVEGRHAPAEGLARRAATEVVEPNPMDLEATTCLSYLMNCDMDGVAIYVQTAKQQLEQAVRSQGQDPAKVQVTRQVTHIEAPPPAPPAAPPAPSPAPAPPAAKKKKGLLGRLFGGKD